VNVTLGTRDKTEAHAHSAPLALTSLDWGPLVQAVPLIQSLRLAVSKTPHVSAMQGIRGQMEPHVRSVVAARIKWGWGLVLVYTVPLFQSLQLSVPQTPLVSATLGTREQMEPHALSVVKACTKQERDLLLVCTVPLIQSPSLVVS